MLAVHWFAALGLVTLFSGLWAWSRAIDRHNDALRTEAHINDMARDWQEAFALLRYGAADEALECLRRCTRRADEWENK
jgi:uncharacterized membrane protein YbaN (DUF454 family)